MTFRRSWVVTMVVFAALLTCRAGAQQFPRLEEESLAGQKIVLPDAASGKVAVMVLGFSRGSSKATEARAKRILSDFGKDPGFVLYQLAVIEDAPRLIRGMIGLGIKKGLPESQRATFVLVTQQEAALKQLVGFKEPDDAYIVVLDRSAKVVYQTHGASTDPTYGELQARLQTLLK